MDFTPTEPTTEVLGFKPPQDDGGGGRELTLVVTIGPEKGSIYTLRPGLTKIGRSAQHADFVLNGRGLSRAHAQVTVTPDGEVEIEDLGSTNGLFVNGERVQSSPLSPGDQISLGPDVALRLELPEKSIQSVLAEMHQSATKDAMTGLHNRRAFMERLQQECSATYRHSLNTCLAILDVDFFKKVNDTYGHPAGDAVLVEVARRLQETARVEDVVARFGGEEFVLLMPNTPLSGGRILLERVRTAIASKPFAVPTPNGDQQINVTISSGLAQVRDGHSPEQLLEQADVCLYEAKQGGRNRVVCRQDTD